MRTTACILWKVFMLVFFRLEGMGWHAARGLVWIKIQVCCGEDSTMTYGTGFNRRATRRPCQHAIWTVAKDWLSKVSHCRRKDQQTELWVFASSQTCSWSLSGWIQIQNIGYRLNPQFGFHTCTTQWEVFCTDTFTTGERWRRQRQEVTY